MANASAGDRCKLPDFPTKPQFGGGNCVQPIVWTGKTLHAGADGAFVATPWTPLKGHWLGYYVELYFKSGRAHTGDHLVSTPGFVWPDDFPFADCPDLATCPIELV